MKRDEIVMNDKNFEVFKFCKSNGIDCSWDFDNSTKWTEIYINGKRCFQFEHSTTVEQFIGAIKLLSENIDPNDICEKVGGEDFFWSIENKRRIKSFIKKHSNVFGINV